MKLNRRQLRRLINETIQEGMDLEPPGKSSELDGKPAYKMHSSIKTLAAAHKANRPGHSGTGRWQEKKQKEGFNSFRFVEKDGAFYLVAEKK